MSTYFAFSDLSSFVPDVLLSKYLIPNAVAIAPRSIYTNVPHAKAEPLFIDMFFQPARDGRNLWVIRTRSTKKR